jgi:vanillate monooxygenase
MMFLQNYWYAVGWDSEITRQPLARTICGEQIVFYRKLNSDLVALEDCCPHRLLPLSKGKLEKDAIVCGYHGLTIAGNGTCSHMPDGRTPPKKPLVKSYPIAERHRFVWIWIGNADEADENKIPDLSWCSNPDWISDGQTFHIKCDYKLLVDNLMDLTHENYVHPTSIGQQELMEAPIETASEEKSATVTRWMKNIIPPPFWSANLKSDQKCDRWQICNFSLPANVMIDVGVAITGTGAPEGNRSQGITGIVLNLMTPETETTTWYHWGMARDFDVTDHGLTGRIRDAQAAVFSEDEEVLEAQQQRILERPDRNLVNFSIDSGGVEARKIIDRESGRINQVSAE